MLTADEGFVFTRNGPSLGGVNFGGGQGDGQGNGDGEDQGSDNGETETASISLLCNVSMGGENVTTAAFDFTTGEIEIDEVTGPIVITTWANEH